VLRKVPVSEIVSPVALDSTPVSDPPETPATVEATPFNPRLPPVTFTAPVNVLLPAKPCVPPVTVTPPVPETSPL